MDNAARTRQRVPAIFLPVAAVLYISAEALSPKGTDQVIPTTATALKVLPIAARHPAQLYVAGSPALLGPGDLAVSYAAIAALVRNRGSALATVAALIGGTRRILRSHHQRPGLSQPRRRGDGTPASNSPKNLTSTRPPYDRLPRAAPEQPPTALRSGLSATAVPPQAIGALCFQYQEHRGMEEQ